MSRIPNNIAFRTPIYIHSHPKNLNSDEKIAQLLTKKAQFAVESVRFQMEYIIHYLEKMSINNPLIMDFYNDTHNGHTRIHSKRGNRLVASFESFRRQLDSIQKIQDSNHTIAKVNQDIENVWLNSLELHNKQGSTIEQAFGTIVAQQLVTFFKQEAVHRGNKQKYKNLNITDPIAALLNNNKGVVTKEFQRILRKYLNHLNSEAPAVKKAVSQMEKDVRDYIKKFHDINNLLLDSNSAETLQHRIDAFNGHNIARYSTSGSGSTFEKIFNYLLLDKAVKQIEGSKFAWIVKVTNEEGKEEKIPYEVFGSSSASSGHGVTTDNVIWIVDKLCNEFTTMGFSLKATKTGGKFDSVFKKTVHAKRLVKPFLWQLFSENRSHQILYYLGNDQAFSVFMAPYRYDKVITKTEEGIQIEMPDWTTKPFPTTYDSLTRIRNIVSYIYLVKGLIGALFDKSDFIEAIETEGYIPPIILSFANEDYFTCEILKRLSSLIGYDDSRTEYGNDKLKDYADVTFNTPNFNFRHEDLKELFLLKKLITTNDENRYNEFYSNKINPNYSSCTTYSSVPELLYEITKGLNIYKVVNEISRPMKFNIPVNKLVK